MMRFFIANCERRVETHSVRFLVRRMFSVEVYPLEARRVLGHRRASIFP